MQSKSHDSVGALTDTLTDEVAVQVFDGTVLSAEFIFCRLPIFEIFENFVLRVSILLFEIVTDGFVEDLSSAFVSCGSEFVVIVVSTERIRLRLSLINTGCSLCE